MILYWIFWVLWDAAWLIYDVNAGSYGLAILMAVLLVLALMFLVDEFTS